MVKPSGNGKPFKSVSVCDFINRFFGIKEFFAVNTEGIIIRFPKVSAFVIGYFIGKIFPSLIKKLDFKEFFSKAA